MNAGRLTYAIYEAAASLAEPVRHQYIHASAPDAEIADKVLSMLRGMEACASQKFNPKISMEVM